MPGYWNAHSDRDFEDENHDTRILPCDYCDGGWAESAPTPTPHGPHYTYSQCTACGGTGEVEIELAPIEQEDLP